jgi:hypothetical protein
MLHFKIYSQTTFVKLPLSELLSRKPLLFSFVIIILIPITNLDYVERCETWREQGDYNTNFNTFAGQKT